MFIKNLKVESLGGVIRDIPFHSGVNLIVDNTPSSDRKLSGNNVGKTTVIRLIDFCLGGSGKNIYQDPEFKNSAHTEVERFLKEREILVTLTLKKDLEVADSEEVVIERNFLAGRKRIQRINDVSYKNKDFLFELGAKILGLFSSQPTFRQVISKNIRDEKSRLSNTVKVLHPTTTREQYEALYLYWLGVSVPSIERKQELYFLKRSEESLQTRLEKESTRSQIEQSLVVLDQDIASLTEERAAFGVDDDYESGFSELTSIKSRLTQLSSEVDRLEFRKSLITESIEELRGEKVDIEAAEVQALYKEAGALMPEIHKRFEDVLRFHNRMVSKREDFILKDLPELEADLDRYKKEISLLCIRERAVADALKNEGALDTLDRITEKLSELHERKGHLLELSKLWQDSDKKLKDYEGELHGIDELISNKDEIIKERVKKFNKFFARYSSELYGERFILIPEKDDRGYELRVSSVEGNLGTGKKKGQISAFDIAYIAFAREEGIACAEFILHDQIETVHHNQMSKLFELVEESGCQYIAPVLADKLPSSIDLDRVTALRLSQSDKFFRL